MKGGLWENARGVAEVNLKRYRQTLAETRNFVREWKLNFATTIKCSINLNLEADRQTDRVGEKWSSRLRDYPSIFKVQSPVSSRFVLC